MKRLTVRNQTERGVQLAELALVLPILLMLLAAIIEFSQYFYTYTMLSKATRVGARYLSARALTEGEKTKAINLVVCGDPASCTGLTPVLPGLTTGKVTITASDASIAPNTIKVSITGFQYQPIINLASFVGGNPWQNVTVSPSTTMKYMLEN
jgi:Flp pilus assembly protein TadG